ncbi:MAG: DNA repair protein RadA [Bacillota bacterium]
MAKSKIKYVCQNCGYESAKWLGRCTECMAWNTFAEEIEQKEPPRGFVGGAGQVPRAIAEIEPLAEKRLPAGLNEFDRVLGGGIVPGSLFLVGGDPGIGKSTLLLQVADLISRRHGKVLYVSGEESAHQTRLRAERLGKLAPELYLLAETNLTAVAHWLAEMKPVFVIIDSIQTMYNPELPTAPGSVGQVRECTGQLLRMAKNGHTAIAIVGHVTKEGNIAGPRMLEHMVDAVLYFEGDRHYSFRILRAVKNRFGSTNESGIFAMEETGLAEVLNPSAMFLAERSAGVAGSVVVACMEGTRSLLVELQALVTPTCFGMPRRMAAGVDSNRLNLLLAVLEKKVGLQLQSQDTYINVAGGLKVDEPAVDLAIILAAASSFRNAPTAPDMVVMGEVGLAGEVRAIIRVEQRIQEAVKLGFRRFVVPRGGTKELGAKFPDVEIIPVASVVEAMDTVLGG